jgi:hypothetical protein
VPQERKTPVRLALLFGALALAAVLILGGVLALAAAWVPVRVPHTPTAESTPRPLGTSPAKPGTASTGAEQLAIRDWSVAAAEVMGPGRFEYNDLLGDEILARIQALRDRSAATSLAGANAALAPFGYRLELRVDDQRQKTLYDLYREGESEPLLAGLVSIWRVSVNA